MEQSLMDKSLFSISVSEFIEAIKIGMAETLNDTPSDEISAKKHYVYGLKGLCSLLGCSISTAARIKKSGAIDAATSQQGKIIVFDSDLVIDILNVQHKRRGNRKGYRI